MTQAGGMLWKHELVGGPGDGWLGGRWSEWQVSIWGHLPSGEIGISCSLPDTYCVTWHRLGTSRRGKHVELVVKSQRNPSGL